MGTLNRRWRHLSLEKCPAPDLGDGSEMAPSQNAAGACAGSGGPRVAARAAGLPGNVNVYRPKKRNVGNVT